jgi:hypothetical protein
VGLDAAERKRRTPKRRRVICWVSGGVTKVAFNLSSQLRLRS